MWEEWHPGVLLCELHDGVATRQKSARGSRTIATQSAAI
jgi:hypothetical protein